MKINSLLLAASFGLCALGANPTLAHVTLEQREAAVGGPNKATFRFVLTVYLIDELKPDAMLYFPVVQECEQGVHRWIETPEAGKPADLPEPAPGLKLLPARRH